MERKCIDKRHVLVYAAPPTVFLLKGGIIQIIIVLSPLAIKLNERSLNCPVIRYFLAYLHVGLLVLIHKINGDVGLHYNRGET